MANPCLTDDDFCVASDNQMRNTFDMPIGLLIDVLLLLYFFLCSVCLISIFRRLVCSYRFLHDAFEQHTPKSRQCYGTPVLSISSMNRKHRNGIVA